MGTRLCCHSSRVTRQQMGEFTSSQQQQGARNAAILVLISAKHRPQSHSQGVLYFPTLPCQPGSLLQCGMGLLKCPCPCNERFELLPTPTFWDLLERCHGPSLPFTSIEQPSSGATTCPWCLPSSRAFGKHRNPGDFSRAASPHKHQKP